MKIFLFMFLLLPGAAQATPFDLGDTSRGAKIFAHYDCNKCHREMVAGDGSAIFTRTNRIVTSSDKLIPRIKLCSGNIGANLSAQEEQDLAAHLNQRFYHFK
jgi:hypothetical protein